MTVARGTDLDRAVAVLRAGGLVAFPTETVYGLGADAARADAVARVFAVKGRPTGHPLIVHLADAAAIDDWGTDLSPAARALAAAAWPGPLTIIVRRGARVSTVTTGGADTVGLRVPAHPIARQLLAAFGGGVAAPSANRFGAVSPTTAQHVLADLGGRLDAARDYLLDGGPCAVGVESTIVDCSRGGVVMLRPGGMPRAAIEAILGPRTPVTDPAVADATIPAAPGTLASHYAPRALVIACAPADVPREVGAAVARGEVVAVLAPASAFVAWDFPMTIHVHVLPDDDAGMARELYAALRDLDAAGVHSVIAALPDAAGLGEAVGDRLRRAAGPRDRSE